jgi:tetratricopeptide (TPR) repeat protein
LSFIGSCPGKCLAAIALSAISGALFPEQLDAAEQWIKLETPHFELYTTAGEKRGREAILYFEQVRSFFLQASPSKRAPELPVRIVAFRSEGQYKPYRMSEGAVAYYAQSRNREFIVMQDISTEHYPAAIHEYTHLVIQRAGLKLPVWLNEGWAELYSSLKPQGNKAIVGELLPGRVQPLLTMKWLDLPVLTSVDQNSAMYNERDKAGIFYAESWLLVHMLYISPDYSTNFAKFVLAIANGQDTAQSFQGVYGKGLKEVSGDLARYIKSDKFYARVFDVKLEKSAEDPQVSEATPYDSGLVLADLLSFVHRPEEARRAYLQLVKDNPDKPEVDESLGYLALQSSDLESAREHFARAYAAGTKSPQMCFDYAMLESQEATAGKAVIPILRRAVELKPDYTEARWRLGVLLASQELYSEALEQLHQIPKVSAEQAPSYFLALAYSDFHTGHLAEARKNAEAAKKWAKVPAESEQADSLLRAFDSSQAASAQAGAVQLKPPTGIGLTPSEGNGDPDRPTLRHRPAPTSDVREEAPQNSLMKHDDQLAHVEGVAQRLDCDGKSARLHVVVGRTPVVFEIPDPSNVLIKHSGEVHHDFTCGAQKPFPVSVEYAVKPDMRKGTAGIVRELDF